MQFLIVVIFCIVFEAVLGDDELFRSKRQSRSYICGTAPYRFITSFPCVGCTNGGQKIGYSCNNAAQCTRYFNGTSTCISGCCCTVPVSNNAGFCSDGLTSSSVRCSAFGQCSTGRTCMNGLCCETTGNEWQNACGGLAAIASCINGGCGQGFRCTPSNYCCECPVGRSSGRCNNGFCPSGFTCQNNGYCCASCPGNATPYGVCRNGACGGGATCRAGNICCL